MRILAIGLMCATMICFTGPGHVRQMAERVFADRTDRLGALRWGVADRARRVAISVAASHATFEAPSTAAVALRFALLFDDRERARRPRAPAVGDCDDLVSHAGLRGSSGGTCAGRKSERGTHDRNRARISRRGDRYAARSRGVSADRSASRSPGLSAIRDTCWPLASSPASDFAADDARLDPNRRHRVFDSDIAMDLAAAPVGDRLGDHGGNGRFRRPPATEC